MTTHVKKTGLVAVVKEMVTLLFIVFIIRTFGFGLYQVPTGSMETTVLVGERFFADKFTILFSPIKRGEIIAFNQPGTMFAYSTNSIKYFIQKYIWGPLNLTKRVIAIPGDVIKGVVEDGKPVIYLNGKKLDEPYLNKYPLVAVYKGSKEEVEELSDNQLAELLLTHRIDSSRINEIKAQLKHHFTVLKSFDPSMPWDKQPFYRINPEYIAYGPDGKPMVLYPNTLSAPDYQPEHHGKQVWGHNSDEFYLELGPDQYWCMGDNRLGSGDSRTFGPVEGKHIHGRIIFRIWSVDSDDSWWILDLLRNPIDFWSRVRWDRFFQVVK